MDDARIDELLQHIPTLVSLDEATSFRERLRDQGEQLTTAVYAALIERMEVPRKREGNR